MSHNLSHNRPTSGNDTWMIEDTGLLEDDGAGSHFKTS